MAKAKKTRPYIWQGIDPQGRLVSGVMEANGEAVVATHLRRQGIKPQRIRKERSIPGLQRGVKGRDLTLFTRQLATLIRAGIPIVTALEKIAASSESPKLKKVITAVRDDIASGLSLTDALKKHPRQFDTLYCSLVQVGEQTGSLDTVLGRLANYLEKRETIKGKVRSALVYPAFIFLVAIGVMTVMLVYVIPALKGVFESVGAQLPAPTRAVLALSDFMVHYGWAIVAAIAFLVWLFFYFKRKSIRFQKFVDRLLLKIPIIGDILRKAAIARFSRTFATTFAAGVPLSEALGAVSGATGNWVYHDATRLIQQAVSEGRSIAVAMDMTKVFPPFVVQMAAMGEESGELENMMANVAEFHEGEVDRAVANLASLLEPIIIVIVGLMVGSLVVSMYLPIFQMAQNF
jgi:type IV pilus assembly protein PilC